MRPPKFAADAGPKLHIVTQEQYQEGYLEFGRRGPFIERRQFEIIRRLPDGNIVVRDPASGPSPGA